MPLLIFTLLFGYSVKRWQDKRRAVNRDPATCTDLVSQDPLYFEVSSAEQD